MDFFYVHLGLSLYLLQNRFRIVDSEIGHLFRVPTTSLEVWSSSFLGCSLYNLTKREWTGFNDKWYGVFSIVDNYYKKVIKVLSNLCINRYKQFDLFDKKLHMSRICEFSVNLLRNWESHFKLLVCCMINKV